MESICKQCGQSFAWEPKQGHPRKYCSPACRIAYWNGSRAPTTGEAGGGTLVCEVCGTSFQYKRLYGAIPKYCSDACRVQGLRAYHAAYDAVYNQINRERKNAVAGAYREAHREELREKRRRYDVEHKGERAARAKAKRAANYKPEIVTIMCPVCGIVFEFDKNERGQHNRRYCSDLCSRKARDANHVRYVANYYARNRGKFRAYNTEYAKTHREQINTQSRLRERAEREARGIKPRLAARIEYRAQNQPEGEQTNGSL